MQKIQNGWFMVYGYEVMVDEGKVVRGMRSGRAVYPYTACKTGGWDKNTGLSLAAFRARMARGTAAMM